MSTREELLAKANKPSELAMKLHPYYRGKIQTALRCPVESVGDFAIWYTPGVAAPCKAIQANKDLAYEYTCKWNTVAVVSDGTRVLGLGDIGPEAAMPVMEGKALLFKYLGGVDAVPICLDTKDPDKFIETVKFLQPSFGGINLEDIEQPKCFYILERLREEMTIPVWHDDQQGTAAVTVAGMMNAAKIVGKKLSEMKIAMVGAGAASIRTAKMLIAAGVNPGNIVMTDTKGTLHKGRKDLESEKSKFKEKWEMCLETNAEGITGGIPEAMRGADALVALAKPGPGTVRKEWVAGMASNPIVFACANPTPEIWPWEAKEAGARVVATGRSDFPNQVNNSLGFPAIFRGALDVRAKTITDEMCIAAAKAMADYQESRGLDEEHLLPTMDDWEVYPMEAAAVGAKAVEQGVARINLTYEQLRRNAEEMIKISREMTRILMEKGVIPARPELSSEV
ncbi:MAG TPA: NADP-dependent malic enzyme [Firmicutes bacterium]|nr:NADP-dependent malic enzyme [Bacillota bacterium]